ncbi:MAG: dienelactone hydrolase family protein [Candidatus Eisenbacteria bacterium]
MSRALRTHAAIAALLLAPVLAWAQAGDEHAGHAHGEMAAPEAPAAAAVAPVHDPKLPAGEAGAKAVLETSPRHGEFVDIAVPGRAAPLRAWVVYPERRDKAPVVVVIHEIFGLSDWIRGVTDQLAKEGFLAVAPDLLSGLGPNGGGTESLACRDDAVKLVRTLKSDSVQACLAATRAWATAQPSASGRCGAVGFCWGGSTSFQFAIAQPSLDGAVVYYGASPDSAALQRLAAPVLGLYGEDDARVVATVEPAKRVLAARKAAFETHLYPGAGHGFLRQQDQREGANLAASRQAWERTIAFLREKTQAKARRY